MKQYLVKLNHPVLVEDGTREESRMEAIYGFLGPEITDNQEQNDYLEDDIYSYVGYLAAMHDWSVNADVEFSLSGEKNWIDKDGHEHPTISQWAFEIGDKHRKDLGLSFTLYGIDLDGLDGVCPECGRDRSLIICGTLMDNLVRLAEQQEEEESKGQYNVILFNRPFWLPECAFWPGQDGHCHIYGLVADREIDDDYLKTIELYPGYLAMCEEYTLAGKTPSGYTTKEGRYWYKDGKKYFVTAEEIKAECLLCQRKHNLKWRIAVVRMPKEDMEEGTREDFIIYKWLYEDMIEKTGIAKDENWMSEIH